MQKIPLKDLFSADLQLNKCRRILVFCTPQLLGFFLFFFLFFYWQRWALTVSEVDCQHRPDRKDAEDTLKPDSSSFTSLTSSNAEAPTNKHLSLIISVTKRQRLSQSDSQPHLQLLFFWKSDCAFSTNSLFTLTQNATQYARSMLTLTGLRTHSSKTFLSNVLKTKGKIVSFKCKILYEKGRDGLMTLEWIRAIIF